MHPTAAESVVETNAVVATRSAATAEPALKPYQPTHSIPVPAMQSTMLCGGIGMRPNCRRFPSRMQRISADHPLVMWTTMPPAKSIAFTLASGFHTPLKRPPSPHIKCAIGKYTTNIQRTLNSITAENFIRSATAPIVRAGVMIANVS